MQADAQTIPYKIIPIRDEFLKAARGVGVDDLGQGVEHVLAKGGEPCRDVLRRAEAGEALILASYCPFRHAGPYREYGPIFILAEADARSASPATLPVDGTLPYLGASFVLRAYSEQERILDAVVTTPQNATADLQRLFDTHAPAFVLVRFTAYGCYALRLERATA